MNIFKKKVNETEYVVTSFSAIQGVKLAQKLSKILTSVENDRFGNVNFSFAVDKLIEVDYDLSLTYELLSLTTSNGVAICEGTFNKVFDNKLGEYLDILLYVMEVNFADFFHTALRKINELGGKEKVQDEAPTPNTAV